ncbi:MAG: helix-turn-helix transcriptional regulator [Leptolyngbyaceae cyanobacterium RU_5_1]|nr:helix-turn-helix transcriptional regulator [Leptolyngbyaceae cyanobacterium RU_5_1]
MQVDAQTSVNANQNTTEQRAKIFAALADPTRLRIVELLAEAGEMSGSEIASHIGISLALFCHHSKTLSEAGLIQIRREGQTKYNSLNRGMLAYCFASFGIESPER